MSPVAIETSTSEGYFNVPMKCEKGSAILHDVTTPDDLYRLIEFEQARLDLVNVSWVPAMEADLLQLLFEQFGKAYTDNPSVARRLLASYDRIGLSFMDAAMGRLLVPPPVNQTGIVPGTSCCGADENCLAILQNYPDGIGAICTEYSQCIERHNQFWQDAHPPNQDGSADLPYETCDMTDEHRCACDYRLVASLEQAGHTRCQDCLEDEMHCDCYVYSWMIKHVAKQRPCWCLGNCVQAEFAYVCDVEEVFYFLFYFCLIMRYKLQKCNGFMRGDCRSQVSWCPRKVTFGCVRCHLPNNKDEQGLCSF